MKKIFSHPDMRFASDLARASPLFDRRPDAASTPVAPQSRRNQSSRRRQDIVRQGLFDCERRQLAQQVHDDLGAVLTAIKSCICVAIARGTPGGAVNDSLLEDAAMLVDSAFTTVRKIGVDLRPTLLEEMGLWDAIDWHAKSLSRRSGIRATVHTDAALEARPLSEEYERVIYRVLSEAITNVEKHSRATTLRLLIYERNGFLTAVAEDNGVGAVAQDMSGRGSLGMIGMREQAAEIGGFLTVDSRPGHGVGVSLTIPIDHCYGY